MAVNLQMFGGETWSRSQESRPRGLRKQQTKITFAARAQTLNRLKKNIMGHRDSALLAHSLLVNCRCKHSIGKKNSAKVDRFKYFRVFSYLQKHHPYDFRKGSYA